MDNLANEGLLFEGLFKKRAPNISVHKTTVLVEKVYMMFPPHPHQQKAKRTTQHLPTIPLAPEILNALQSLLPEVLNIISISLTPEFMEYLEEVDAALVTCEGAMQSGAEGARQSGATLKTCFELLVCRFYCECFFNCVGRQGSNSITMSTMSDQISPLSSHI